MNYREPMEHTVRWTDGLTWRAEPELFARVTIALEGLREVILGLGPVLDRWQGLAACSNELPVDEFAATEADRAVFTAALARALDDARGAADGEPSALADALVTLHELFVTDVTRNP